MKRSVTHQLSAYAFADALGYGNRRVLVVDAATGKFADAHAPDCSPAVAEMETEPPTAEM